MGLLSKYKKKQLQRLFPFFTLPPFLWQKQCRCIIWLLSLPPDDFRHFLLHLFEQMLPPPLAPFSGTAI